MEDLNSKSIKDIIRNMIPGETIRLSANSINGIKYDPNGDMVEYYPDMELLSCQGFIEALDTLPTNKAISALVEKGNAMMIYNQYGISL